eukprot:11931927-Heterocapsa_arctica.AAC.1
MAGEEHEKEDTKDVQSTQEQHKMDEDIIVTQISGEQKMKKRRKQLTVLQLDKSWKTTSNLMIIKIISLT